MGELLRFAARGEPPEAPETAAADLSERSDEDLMALVRLGSRTAFRALVVRHADKVASFCARVTGDRAGARELTQEVWLALWDARARWEPRSRFTAYLYGIAFTRARNHVRARRRRAAVFSAEALRPEVVATNTGNDVDRLLDIERRARVWEALGTLPEPMREALVLRFVEDLSYEEMELVLRTNASTLRSRVHHAIARLKRHLHEEEP